MWFDDTRTVTLQTSALLSLPTTFHSDSTHLTIDLKSNFIVTGSSISEAFDQWITHREQIEKPGPFVEHKLFEQDEHAVYNSCFMTGAAYAIAPDRFKSGVSNKTIIRMEYPLTQKSSFLPTTSSMMYFNSNVGRFETTVRENSFNVNTGQYPSTFAPILFTPYGLHYMPLNDYSVDSYGGGSVYIGSAPAPAAYRQVTSYAADGNDTQFYVGNAGYSVGRVTASLLNTSHIATGSQLISMKTMLSSPFLLEKIVVEFPFEAGSGWLNDCFGISHVFENDLTYTIDAGGPTITFALLRQDKTGEKYRDLIASATISPYNDVKTGSYSRDQVSYIGVGDFDTIIYSHEGIGGMRVNPTVVITGSSIPVGETNHFTGTIKFVMDPQITSHVWRLRVSGTSAWYYNGGSSNDAQADGLVYGSIARRSAKFIGGGRSVLGNQFALISPKALDGALNPVNRIDSQYENLAPGAGPPPFATSKIFTDVVATTVKSPYLLYPEDDLVLCFSKHRACGSHISSDWKYYSTDSGNPKPLITSASHDVGIGAGSIKITLYGDLIKEDREFHDTLNQRLETVELWENIGEEPVLDQFDVVYSNELSGSYLDRFSVFKALSYATGLTSSNDTTQFYSNFMHTGLNNPWDSSQMNWAKERKVHELQKSCRNAVFTSDNDVFWDCRLLVPNDIINLTTPNYGLGYWSVPAKARIFSSPGVSDYEGIIFGWWMSYPYEQKFNTLSTTLDNLTGADYGPLGGSGKQFFNYADLVISTGGGTAANSYIAGNLLGLSSISEFIKYFFGIGDWHGPADNQAVMGRRVTGELAPFDPIWNGAELRGWRYGMLNGFPTKPICMFRRDRFGQFRDMLEQRLDAKFHDGNSARESPVQVRFYDQKGRLTLSTRTLSSNLSTEATSSMPYTDGVARNRSAIDYGNLNISTVVF